jgi:excinuclease UvrABC nuclease subunit
MSVFAGDMSKLILKRTVRADLGEVSLDSEMLRVLMELDGSKNLGQVARSLDMNLKQLKLVLDRLYKLRLCETAKEATLKLDRTFFHFLSAELSKAMGPIADVVIEDEIREMGENYSKFPAHRAAELVDVLARQILREERKVAFQQAMVRKLREVKT